MDKKIVNIKLHLVSEVDDDEILALMNQIADLAEKILGAELRATSFYVTRPSNALELLIFGPAAARIAVETGNNVEAQEIAAAFNVALEQTRSGRGGWNKNNSKFSF